MDEAKRFLRGSQKRDIFKQKHKELDGKLYASDADFCLISKSPPGVVAYLDYKGSGEGITFAEGILYNEWVQRAPVYIVEADDPENGPFTIRRYLGANWIPNPVDAKYDDRFHWCVNWQEFEKWEKWLRDEYERRGGWSVVKFDETLVKAGNGGKQ